MGGFNYQKKVQSTFNSATRQNLQTAKRVKNNPNSSYSHKKYWDDFEKTARPAVRKAYNKQGDLEQLMTK